MHLSKTPGTSFLRGNHQCLGCLAPAFPRLRCDAKNIDRLRFEVGDRVLAGAGVQDVHGRSVAVARVQVVCDLVGWRREADKRKSQRYRNELGPFVCL